MLIVIVVLFGTLWLPYRIVVVYNSFQDSLLQFKDSWFWLFCRTMVFINSAINPIVYNMLSVKFRRAFRDIVCKGKISLLLQSLSFICSSVFWIFVLCVCVFFLHTCRCFENQFAVLLTWHDMILYWIAAYSYCLNFTLISVGW